MKTLSTSWSQSTPSPISLELFNDLVIADGTLFVNCEQSFGNREEMFENCKESLENWVEEMFENCGESTCANEHEDWATVGELFWCILGVCCFCCPFDDEPTLLSELEPT